jgi:hypothetical protein
MMQIIFTWILAIMLITVCTMAFYITQPIGYLAITESNTIYQATGPSMAQAAKMTATGTILLLFNDLWCPILDCVFLLWALISSSKRDIESEMM